MHETISQTQCLFVQLQEEVLVVHLGFCSLWEVVSFVDGPG